LLAARGLPALYYKSLTSGAQKGRGWAITGDVTQFPGRREPDRQLDLIRPAVSAALVAAGLLSVLLFPLTALTLLRGAEQPEPLEPVR
jgi:hypothetical protein